MKATEVTSGSIISCEGSFQCRACEQQEKPSAEACSVTTTRLSAARSTVAELLPPHSASRHVLSNGRAAICTSLQHARHHACPHRACEQQEKC